MLCEGRAILSGSFSGVWVRICCELLTFEWLSLLQSCRAGLVDVYIDKGFGRL